MEERTMNKQHIENLIKERTESLIQETGLCGKELQESVINSFLQDFFFEEISKEELDQIADQLGVQINIQQ